MVEVKGLINRDMLVEIEADAVMPTAPLGFRDSSKPKA
jgi:hypothetical protein